jgi:hypothetical protein
MYDLAPPEVDDTSASYRIYHQRSSLPFLMDHLDNCRQWKSFDITV